MHREYPVAGPLRIKLRLAEGTARIHTHDAPTAHVEITPLGSGERSRRAAEEARVELESSSGGQELLVEVDSIGRALLRRSGAVRVTIACPHGAAFEAETATADITAGDRLARVKITSASGDIEVGAVEGDVVLRTASGDAHVASAGGEVSINTASGDVRVGRAGRVSANLASGDLIVAHCGPASVRSASGDVRLEAVASGQVEIKTVSGDISVGVEHGSQVYVDAHSVSGDLHSELTLGDAPGEASGPLVELRARTVSGDLMLSRAS